MENYGVYLYVFHLDNFYLCVSLRYYRNNVAKKLKSESL